MNEGLNQRDVDSLFKRTSSGGKLTADSLTQREIDAILQKTSPIPLAPVTSDEIVSYNFSRPPRVSKDRRAILDSIYTRYSLSVQALLSSMLRMPVDVVVGSVEQAMFSEFILSLGTPCASFVFAIGDRMGGEGAIDLSTDFAFHLVDRLFGGPGDPQVLARPLTSLEQTVVRNVADRALGLLRETWQEHLTINPQIVGFESNPEMLQITSREDNVLVTNLEIRSTLFNGFMTLCLPMSSIESFLQEKGSGRSPVRHTDAEAMSIRQNIQGTLKHAHLNVTSRFPMLWLSARQIADLVPGKVLHTGQGSDQAVELLVNDRLRFMGSLGQSNGHLGIRITEPVNKPIAVRAVQSKQGRVM